MATGTDQSKRLADLEKGIYVRFLHKAVIWWQFYYISEMVLSTLRKFRKGPKILLVILDELNGVLITM